MCLDCEQRSVTRVPVFGDDRRCLVHAIEFWTGLVAMGAQQARTQRALAAERDATIARFYPLEPNTQCRRCHHMAHPIKMRARNKYPVCSVCGGRWTEPPRQWGGRPAA